MGQLLGTVLFGSVARGDDDSLSDLDVLALVKNGAGRVSEEEVVATLGQYAEKGPPTVSWYGADRFMAMHGAGELFAWHLHLDGKILHDPGGILGSLGQPSPYQRALADVDAFLDVAAALPEQLRTVPPNAVYEMGVLYVCLRNVAMSLSAVVAKRPDFTRLAPYHFPALGLEIAQEEYHLSMRCRLAGQRGSPPPSDIGPARVLAFHHSAQEWMIAARRLVQEH